MLTKLSKSTSDFTVRLEGKSVYSEIHRKWYVMSYLASTMTDRQSKAVMIKLQ
jgi:hypothetical protein